MIILKAKLTSLSQLLTQLNLTFAVKEMTEEDQIRLEQAKGEEGFLLFHGDEIKKSVEEIMKDKTIGVNEEGRSPSQILRGAIFQAWDRVYSGPDDFDSFYKRAMEKFTEQVKKSYRNRK
jgi:Glu-tRNA(Gln) amidotransferase subunit E-like FAD-binding protein